MRSGVEAVSRPAFRRLGFAVPAWDLSGRHLVGVLALAGAYVVAEALTNAQKHAHASSVRVRATATRDALRLEIADDGTGGATEPASGGLTGLRDRVEALGGAFDVDSPSGHGTRIAAAIPQRPAASGSYGTPSGDDKASVDRDVPI